LLYASLKPVVTQSECRTFSLSRPGVFQILVGTHAVKSVSDKLHQHIFVSQEVGLLLSVIIPPILFVLYSYKKSEVAAVLSIVSRHIVSFYPKN